MRKRIVGLLLAMVMTLGLISVAAMASGAEVTADWANFRNSEVNMALTEAKTPVDAETTVLKWANKLMTGWTDAPSVQIIVDNALIVMHGTNLSKLDLKTGEIIQQATMTAAPNYGYTPATYADGLIFCPLSGGTIQAFDAKTLESKWIFKDELGGQSLSPITYSDGCIYTGFWNGEEKDANYVCVDVADGSLKWSKTVTGGFYWAGSVVLGDAVIVGCDDGAKGYAGDSHLYSLNKASGEVISDLTLTGCGDQRSTIAYSEEKGRVYFTAKNGYLCSAAVDTDAGTLSDLKTVKQANQCTSTPVVYGNQVYFSCGSGVVQGEGGDGNFVVADADTLEQLYVVALQAYPQGSVLVSKAYLEETGKLYCYSTYNGKPGGLSLIKVDPTKDTADGAELIEIYDAKGYEQNCITSPICGTDGTIYYKNDSGNVFAVGINNAYLAGLTATAGAQKGEFAASDAEIEWIVPIGTESVSFAPTACEGGTVTVNGGAADTAVSLVEGTATATIVVTKGEDSRTYTVSVREISADAALNELKVSESNSYTGAALALTPEWADGTYYYGMYTVGASRKFENVWPTANDVNAKVTVYAISNVQEGKFDEETGVIEVTGTNQNHDRYAIYFADDTLPMAVRIVVTAENGETTEYVLVMSKEAAAEAGATLLTQIQAEDKLKADKAAAEPVIGMIDAIGTVTLESTDSIKAARDAYEALTEDQKALVTNVDVLTAAEDRLEVVKDENTATPVDVQVTIAVSGKVVMAQQTVTVTDVNNNGIFDVDDALYAAHEVGFEGGAEAGYASEDTAWGLSIAKLWGDTSYAYGYWLNNASCWSLEDVVAEGNALVAFVYQDGTYWSDAYTKLDKLSYTVEALENLTVTLEMAGYDADWNTVFAAHGGAVLTVYDSELKAVDVADYTVTDNGDGTYTVKIAKAGTYYLVASDGDPITVPAVSAVTVAEKNVENEPEIPDVETGDHSVNAVWMGLLVVSLAMAAVALTQKKRSQI